MFYYFHPWSRPRRTCSFALRAVGIQGFSITQLPVTLEDIDEVWDQAGADDTSGSDTAVRGRSNGSTSSVYSSRSAEEERGPSSPPESSHVSSARSGNAQVSTTEMAVNYLTPVNAEVSKGGLSLAEAGPVMAEATAEAAVVGGRGQGTIAGESHVTPAEEDGASNSHEPGGATPATVLAAEVVDGGSASVGVRDDTISQDDGGEKEGGVSATVVSSATQNTERGVVVNDDVHAISAQEEGRDGDVEPPVVVAGQRHHGVEGGEQTSLEGMSSKEEERVSERTPYDSSTVQIGDKRDIMKGEEGAEKQRGGQNVDLDPSQKQIHQEKKVDDREDDEGETDKEKAQREYEGEALDNDREAGQGKTTDKQVMRDGVEAVESRVLTKGIEPRGGVTIDNVLENAPATSVHNNSEVSETAEERGTEEEASAGSLQSLVPDEAPPASSQPADFSGLSHTDIEGLSELPF